MAYCLTGFTGGDQTNDPQKPLHIMVAQGLERKCINLHSFYVKFIVDWKKSVDESFV